ncbi:hypothetical protein [Actinosynnema sp. NPDC020468]|uniref:hypothetical protein n=1 Tax=Actinosynnema sp. NPDC020468 TaxID=3154488 RepID=UPI0033E2C628
MTAAGESSASLRVVSPTLDVAAITRVMGVEPTGYRVWPDATVWHWSPAPEWWEGFEAVEPVVDFLRARRERVARVLEHARVDVFVGYFAFDDLEVGAVVPRSAWEAMADTGVDVVFDVYPPGPADTDEPEPPYRKWYDVEVTDRGAPRSGRLVHLVDEDRVDPVIGAAILHALSGDTAGRQVRVSFASGNGQGGFGLDAAVVSAVRDAVTPVRLDLVRPPLD